MAAILWFFVYVSLETRRCFHGAAIGESGGVSDAEIYAYSAVWLALGLALLAYGVVRGSREARYASAFFIVATTLKVFIYDLSGLEGALRAFSFIGLGLALIAIGLVYQKLVFAPRACAHSAELKRPFHRASRGPPSPLRREGKRRRPSSPLLVAAGNRAKRGGGGAQQSLRQSRCLQAKTFIHEPSAKHISTSQAVAGAQLV